MSDHDRRKTITLTVGQWGDIMHAVGDYIERSYDYLKDHGVYPDSPEKSDPGPHYDVDDFEVELANLATAITFFDHLNENVSKED
tara:strand:- start:20 stop:274 length:255 start_codon:yes stop_codon:yes gene_type:complete